MSEITAYADPQGLIGFDEYCDFQTLPIITGNSNNVHCAVIANAQQDALGNLWVPGVPENAGTGKALAALEEFRHRVRRHVERATWGMDPLGA